MRDGVREGGKEGRREGVSEGQTKVPTTSSSESSRPWMLLPSRTACWWPTPLVWLNRCTSEVICPKHRQQARGQRARWTPRRGVSQRAPLGRAPG